MFKLFTLVNIFQGRFIVKKTVSPQTSDRDFKYFKAIEHFQPGKKKHRMLSLYMTSQWNMPYKYKSAKELYSANIVINK